MKERLELWELHETLPPNCRRTKQPGVFLHNESEPRLIDKTIRQEFTHLPALGGDSLRSLLQIPQLLVTVALRLVCIAIYFSDIRFHCVGVEFFDNISKCNYQKV